MRRIFLNKNRKYVAGSAAALASVMAACMVGNGTNIVAKAENASCEKNATNKVNIGEAKAEITAEDLETEITDSLNIEEKDIYKNETVYVFSDANGNTKNILVNEVLKNPEGKKELKDVSDLSGIVNVKGDETFIQNGEEITWQANGNDICYQGTSDKELPVDIRVSYYLNDTEITPSELAGKSGKVTIRFDYLNNEKIETQINGKQEEIYVPFAAITGMILGENFTNVTVTNGKTIENGDSKIVIGYGLPGVSDSFGETSNDFSDKISIPDYFEVTADVEDFSLDMTATVVVNASSIQMADGMDFSNFDELVDTLSDSSSALSDGANQLSEGLGTLQSNMGTFSSGVDTLKEGTTSLVGGSSQLNSGAASLVTGASSLQTGMNSLAAGSADLAEGVNTINESAASISTGIAQLDTALNTKMTDEEKQAVAQLAKETYKKDTEGTVANTLYQGLRYNADGTDSALFQSLYDGVYYQNAFDLIYEGAVNTVLTTAAGVSGDSSGLATAIRGSWAEGAQAYMLYLTDPATYVAAGYATDAETIQVYLNAFVKYQATSNLNAAQFAEYLYAQNNDTTLHYVAESTLKNQLATARDNGDVKAGVEDAISTIANTIAAQSADMVAQATIAGAENAKAQIASKIEAVGENGYSLVTGSAALAEGTALLASNVPGLTGGVDQLVEGMNQLVSGANSLSTGAYSLYEGAGKLNTGAQSLVAGTSEVVEGVNQLTDGAVELSDGMSKFDAEAIQKLVDAYNGDVKILAERLHAIATAATKYDTYTKLADGDQGTTKFIIKTEAISAE